MPNDAYKAPARTRREQARVRGAAPPLLLRNTDLAMLRALGYGDRPGRLTSRVRNARRATMVMDMHTPGRDAMGTYYPDLQRHSFFRPPDWRWRRAQWLVTRGRYYSRRRDDVETGRAVRARSAAQITSKVSAASRGMAYTVARMVVPVDYNG